MNKFQHKEKFDQNAYSRIHDAILDCFDINLTSEQINHLVSLCPDWDGIADTAGLDKVMDCISLFFVKRRIPQYGDDELEKKAFEQALEHARPLLIAFLQERVQPSDG